MTLRSLVVGILCGLMKLRYSGQAPKGRAQEGPSNVPSEASNKGQRTCESAQKPFADKMKSLDEFVDQLVNEMITPARH